MWREKEIWLLVALVGCTYFTQIDQPPLRGEETRRARVAQEMLLTGDFIVPRQQGELFLSRPPLQNWIIAAVSCLRGSMDTIAVRLPGVLAILLTVVVIYGYARHWMTPLGALISGAAYATMVHVLELGRLAETESLFTLLVAAALFCWHLGHTQGWNPAWNWMASYGLVGLAMLTKGLQPPVYFGGAVGLYLILSHQWRQLLRWQHFLGLATLAAVVGTWQIPFYLETDWPAVKSMYFNDVGMRFNDSRWSTTLEHLATYPIEVLLCTAPWSFGLVFFLSPAVRRGMMRARPCIAFMVLCLAVAFPSCWFPPASHARYFMPLYPCLAVLIGLAFERCWLMEPQQAFQRWHRRMVHFTAAIMLATGFGIVTARAVPGVWSELFASFSPLWIAAYAGGCLLACVAMEWSLHRKSPMRGHLATLTLAAFLAVTYNGLVVGNLQRRSENVAPRIAELKRRLPADEPLVSLNLVHHLFAFYYRDPIRYLPLDQDSQQEYTYFCFYQAYDDSPAIPFPWKVVEVISCDRHQRKTPVEKMVIGQRLDVSSHSAMPRSVMSRSAMLRSSER